MEIQNQPDLDWRLAWSVSYDTAFALARQYDVLEQSPSSYNREDHERVRAFLLAARILFWFSMNKFVTQCELQRHLLYRLMDTISDQMPAELCFQFARSASLDVLLWILFATYISFVQVRGTPYEGSAGKMRNPGHSTWNKLTEIYVFRLATSNDEVYCEATPSQFLQRICCEATATPVCEKLPQFGLHSVHVDGRR